MGRHKAADYDNQGVTPEGEWPAYVEDVREGETRAGDPAVVVEMTVTTSAGTETMVEKLPTTGRGAFRFASFLRALVGDREVELDELVGQRCRVVVEHVPGRKEGMVFVNVAKFLPARGGSDRQEEHGKAPPGRAPAKAAPAARAPAKAAPDADYDLPF